MVPLLRLAWWATGPRRVVNQPRKRKEATVKLSAPQKATWWVAVIVGVAGILAHLVTIPVLSGFAFWLVAAAFVLLVLATYLKGL